MTGWARHQTRDGTPATAGGAGGRAAATPGPTPAAGSAQGVQVNRAGGNTQVNNFHPPGRPAVSWPVRVGAVPALASAFQVRPGLREQVAAARAAGGGVLSQVLSGGGGVGKSQLAASYAAEAISGGTDLVVWVTASQPGAILGTYAQAAARVQALGADGSDAETDARAFMDWLATTSRPWLVVLDDITDPADAGPWWPSGRADTGWVLATTRRRDAALSGGGRAVVGVEVYTPAESAAYLAGC